MIVLFGGVFVFRVGEERGGEERTFLVTLTLVGVAMSVIWSWSLVVQRSWGAEGSCPAQPLLLEESTIDVAVPLRGGRGERDERQGTRVLRPMTDGCPTNKMLPLWAVLR